MNYYYKPPANDDAKAELLKQFVDCCDHNTETSKMLMKSFWTSLDSVIAGFLLLPEEERFDSAKKENLNICVTFLRARLAEFDARYRIDIYNDAWFILEQEYTANWNLEILHSTLFDIARNARAKYSTAFISESEYTAVYIKACEAIKEYAFQQLAEKIGEITNLASYRDAAEHYTIKIWVGEYMDKVDLIFSSDSCEE